MNTETIVHKIVAEHGLKSRGKLFIGPCPECGGSDRSDKFNIRLDGGFICYSCGFRGDIITWLRKRENMSCPDAHDHAGRECRQKDSCPVAAKCRLGNGNDTSPSRPRRPKHRQPVRPYQGKETVVRPIPVVVPQYPKSEWATWADALVAKAHEKLLNTPEQLAYLAARGIDADGVARFSLGWLDHQMQVSKKKIGLPIEADGKDKLWVPEGLVIPIFDTGGAIHRIRIRRSLEARKKFGPNLKYVWLKGSGNMPMAIQPVGILRGALVAEAELDAMVSALSHPDILTIAIGSLSSGVDQELRNTLEVVPVILASLDAEANSRVAIENWQHTFRHAKFWPTPQGKDAGEFFKLDGDLYAWIERGLPSAPSVPPVPSKPAVTPLNLPCQDGAFSPARKLNGGGGGNKDIGGNDGGAGDDVAIQMPLTNGKIIYLVNKRGEEWERLTKQTLPVFTRCEIEALKVATATMTAEERNEAAMAAIDVKEVFGGYIARGEFYAK